MTNSTLPVKGNCPRGLQCTFGRNGKITDDTRIRGALPTLKKVLADGGSLIIMSHMGKPKGKVNAKYSLSQIVDAVSEN